MTNAHSSPDIVERLRGIQTTCPTLHSIFKEAADKIDHLRASQPATSSAMAQSSASTIDDVPSCGQENNYRRALSSAGSDAAATPLAYRLDHPRFGIELSIYEPNGDWAGRGWTVTPLYAGVSQQSLEHVLMPREPTPAMVSAGMEFIPEDGSEYEHVEAAYRAMVAVALSSTNGEAGE